MHSKDRFQIEVNGYFWKEEEANRIGGGKARWFQIYLLHSYFTLGHMDLKISEKGIILGNSFKYILMTLTLTGLL